MSGYGHHYTTNYAGVTSTSDNNNADVNNPGPAGTMNTVTHTNHDGIPMQGVIPTIPASTMYQQQQQQVMHQHQPPQHQPQSQSQSQSLLYDMSSFDPLQAQALQLSASAGLTTAVILAAAAAPTIATGPGTGEGNSSVSVSVNSSNNMPVARVAAGIPQPAASVSASAYAQSQCHSLSQSPATHSANTSLAPGLVLVSGGLRTIQPVPTATTQATQYPYIFIQPQQITPNAVAAAAATAASPNALLMPTAGVPASMASTQAQAAAVAAAAAAGFGTHPLLFNPAFLSAATQGVPALAAPATVPGQVPLQLQHATQHQTQAQAQTQAHTQAQMQMQMQPLAQKQAQHHHAQMATNALGPALILPAAIHPHQATSHSQLQPHNSRKRPLGTGVAMAMNEIAPSVVSSATAPMTTLSADGSEFYKRQRGGDHTNNMMMMMMNDEDAALKTGNPTEKRRYERNLREQQRSSKISSQIKELREVLSECNVPFKPNKYSILLKVVEYIKQLQSRAIMLDAEHQKLITTVRQTNETVANVGNNTNNNGMSTTTCGATDNDSSDTTCHDAWRHGGEMATPSRDSELCFVKGIDYRSVFEQCPTAFAIAALDGRILECNAEFQSLLGYNTREDLMKQSLFNLVHNHQDIFRAMAQMLKTAEDPTTTSTNATTSDGSTVNNADSKDRFWTGPVTSKQNIILSMNITLTSGDNGTPKFFSCALTNSTV